MLGKKYLIIAAIVVAIALPVSVVYAAWTIDDMVNYMEKTGKPKIWKTCYLVTNDLKPTVYDIQQFTKGTWYLSGSSHNWVNICEAFDDIKNEITGIEEDVQAIDEKMGQGLVGENHEESITLDGVRQVLAEVLGADVRENPKKITLYIDLSRMYAGDTVHVWLCYDADHDPYGMVVGWPPYDAPEDALTGAAYDFTWNDNQFYNVKLVFKQLPISERLVVMIQGTAGLVVPYHWILEEV